MSCKTTYYRSAIFVALVVGSSLALLTGARAEPITYTLTGMGSGSLDGTSFTNDDVTLSLAMDTSTISPTFFPFMTQNNVSTSPPTVSVAGVGTDTLTPTGGLSVGVYVNRNAGQVGFQVVNPANFVSSFVIWAFNNSAFTSYALDAIGPTMGVPFPGATNTTPTGSGGTFQLSPTMGSTSTFEAALGTPPEIPLPPAIYLFGSALGGAFWMSRRKRNAVTASA